MRSGKGKGRGVGSGAGWMQELTAVAGVSMVLLLLGMVLWMAGCARGLSDYVREHIGFSIVMEGEVREAEILRWQKQLEKAPYVKECRYISRQEALREQTEAMGSDPQEFLGYNPFPPCMEVKLRADYANADSIARIERELKEAGKGVREVLYRRELVDAVNENLRRMSLLLAVPAGVLALISFALIQNMVRLRVRGERFLIHTMRLVGASDGFVCRPYVWRGVRTGLMAGLAAAAMLWMGAARLLEAEPELAGVVTTELMGWVSGAVLAVGGLVTGGCAWLSVRRLLRMRVEELYRL